MSLRKTLGAVFLVASSAMTVACGTSRVSASLPHAADWRRAASAALRERDTWIPAAAAVAVGVSGADHRVAEWASRETPLFGSTRRAEDASDLLKGGVHLLMLGTALASRGESDTWSRRGTTALENELATLPNATITGVAKEAFGRERPDGSDHWSFPSGHASVSASYAAITRENLALAKATARTQRMVGIAARLLVAGTAWARVEGKKHYPTDVLAGAALGNLVTRTVDRAFRERTRDRVAIAVEPMRRGAGIWVRLDLSK